MRLDCLLNELEKVYEYKTIEMRNDYSLLPEYHSYRGCYDRLAIDYDYTGTSNEKVTVKQLKDALNEALEVGKMEGYKGGEYPIDLDTEVVIAGYGDVSGFYIAEFFESEDSVYMATAVMD